MTIEEKAREYAGTEDSDAYAGFIDGAEWMQSNLKLMPLVYDRLTKDIIRETVEKAANWFTAYLGEIGYPDDWLRDSKVQQSGIERFRKAMEE